MHALLDDTAKIKEIDKSNMLEAIRSLPEQLERGTSLAKDTPIPDIMPSNIVIGGMGGSAIGGDILTSLLFRRASVPIYVNRNMFLPRFANASTLLFIVSYSGNTTETVNMMKEGIQRGCKIIAITSGGEIKRLAKKHGTGMVQIPNGMAPRASIGYLFAPILTILSRMKLYDLEVEIMESVRVLGEIDKKTSQYVRFERNPAKKLAVQLKDSIPIIYGHTVYGVVARRWHTQLNENSKVLSWWGSLPEVNHNEIVGWNLDERGKHFKIIILRDNEEDASLEKNIKGIKKIAKCAGIIDIHSKGTTYLSRIMSTIFMGDMVSFYMAILGGVDPSPVEPITTLKNILKE